MISKKNRQKDTGQEITQMLELVDKYMKTVVTIFHIFQNVEKIMSLLKREIKNKKDPN